MVKTYAIKIYKWNRFNREWELKASGRDAYSRVVQEWFDHWSETGTFLGPAWSGTGRLVSRAEVNSRRRASSTSD